MQETHDYLVKTTTTAVPTPVVSVPVDAGVPTPVAAAPVYATVPTPVVSAPVYATVPATVATTERVEQYTVDPDASRRSTLYTVRQAIWLVFGLVEGLIAIRFVLRLLGASPNAGFAQLIYGVTAVLVAPFAGLFGTPRFEGSVLEITSLVAIVVYALAAWVLVKVIVMFSAPRGTAV
jgi:hypothetical protein